MRASRRAFLAAGAGVAAAVAAPRSLRHEVKQLLTDAPSSPHPVPSGPVGTVKEGAFRSDALRQEVGWSVAFPDGVAPLPLLLVMHGRGNDHGDVLGSHRLGAFLSDAVRRGVPPFAVVAVDGGSSYWHRRKDGTDPQAMVLDELLPLMAAQGLKTDRIALGGWSMGGYGALLLAQRLGPARVAACVPDSPALFLRVQDSAEGAFDGSADFAANDVLAHTGRLAGIQVRVSCGTSDPFLPGVRALLAKVPSAQSDLGPGAHDVAWWRHAAPAQLAFAGRHLA